MASPVLFQEMLLGARRNRAYFFRWAYAAWIVLQLIGFSFLSSVGSLATRGNFNVSAQAEFCRSLLETFVTQHYLVLLLVTPVLTAGAITDEKSRGTLQYLLVTELSAREIVVGKLLARLYQVLLVALTPLPLICSFGVFGGLDMLKLLSFSTTSVAIAFGVGSLSLLASVLCRQTRDAVIVVYIALAAFFACGLDPIHPMGNSWILDDASEHVRKLLQLAAVWVVLGVACLALASLRLRGAYLRYLEGARPRRRRWWWPTLTRRARITGNPVYWKERQIEGLAPLPVLRTLPQWLGVTATFVAAFTSSIYIVAKHLELPTTLATLLEMAIAGNFPGLARAHLAMSSTTDDFYLQGFFVMLLAGLVIAIRCSGAVTGEREKSTWELLLLTPLETRQLIRGKLWGITGASGPYLIAYAVPTLVLALLCGTESALWAAVWLGVTLLAIGFVGAAGLWCSVRAKTSWRSLLGTLGITYLGGFILFCVTSPIMVIVAILLFIALSIVEKVLGFKSTQSFEGFFGFFGLAMCITLAGGFAFMAWRFIIAAEYRINMLERIKHWRNEPKHPRWSRFGRERLQMEDDQSGRRRL